MDKDFSKLFHFPTEKYDRLMAIKIYKCTIEETLSIFKKGYETIQEEDIAGNLVVITPIGVRIRRSIN